MIKFFNCFFKVSILLVREKDGIIYNTGFHYTYTDSNFKFEKLYDRLNDPENVYFPNYSFR